MENVSKEIEKCKKCRFLKGRINPVLGEGNAKAKIVFVGEAPGRTEDESGRPFCGRAGKVLDELLLSIGVKREDVFITNILKCRPPKNRDPKKKEIENCFPFLEKQIKMIGPDIICPLGRFSSKYILDRYIGKRNWGIGEIHGKRIKGKDFTIIPMYHPAFAVYNNKNIKILKRDFKKIINKK